MYKIFEYEAIIKRQIIENMNNELKKRKFDFNKFINNQAMKKSQDNTIIRYNNKIQ